MSEVGIGHHPQVIKLFSEHFKGRSIRGIEIGTAAGDLALDILHQMPNVSKIYTIDPWTFVKGRVSREWYPQELLDKAKVASYKKLMSLGDKVDIIALSSDDAASLFSGLYDFVWIDGDHAHDQVTRDLDNYGPLVAPGGILGGHDVHIMRELLLNRFGDKLNLGDDWTWWVFNEPEECKASA